MPTKRPPAKPKLKEPALPATTVEARRQRSARLLDKQDRELNRGGILGPDSNQFRGGVPGQDAFTPLILT